MYVLPFPLCTYCRTEAFLLCIRVCRVLLYTTWYAVLFDTWYLVAILLAYIGTIIRRESRKKENKKKKKKCSGGDAHGGFFQDLEIVKSNFAQGIRSYVRMTRTRWDIFTTFHNKFRASCGRPKCVLPLFADTCSSSSSIPITQSPPSPLYKPPPSSRCVSYFSCLA